MVMKKLLREGVYLWADNIIIKKNEKKITRIKTFRVNIIKTDIKIAVRTNI